VIILKRPGFFSFPPFAFVGGGEAGTAKRLDEDASEDLLVAPAKAEARFAEEGKLWWEEDCRKFGTQPVLGTLLG
jgi:hypothetical protein